METAPLFKISKGLSSNLPGTYTEGHCYFTTDDGKMYIDTSNQKEGRKVLNADKADKDGEGHNIISYYVNKEEVNLKGKAKIEFNTNNNCINFIFL